MRIFFLTRASGKMGRASKFCDLLARRASWNSSFCRALLRYSSEFTVFSFHSFRFKTARVVPYRRTDTVCQTSLYTIRMVCTDGKRWSRSVDGPIKATWIIFMFHSKCVEKLWRSVQSVQIVSGQNVWFLINFFHTRFGVYLNNFYLDVITQTFSPHSLYLWYTH